MQGHPQHPLKLQLQQRHLPAVAAGRESRYNVHVWVCQSLQRHLPAVAAGRESRYSVCVCGYVRACSAIYQQWQQEEKVGTVCMCGYVRALQYPVGVHCVTDKVCHSAQCVWLYFTGEEEGGKSIPIIFFQFSMFRFSLASKLFLLFL